MSERFARGGAQVITLSRLPVYVMAEKSKKKIGIYIDTTLAAELYGAAGVDPADKSAKGKSWAHAAAILFFLEAPENVRDYFMQKLTMVGKKDVTIESIIQAARDGVLRNEAARLVVESPNVKEINRVHPPSRRTGHRNIEPAQVPKRTSTRE